MPLTYTGQSAGNTESLEALTTSLGRLEGAGIAYAEVMPDRYWVLTGGMVNRDRLTMMQRVLDRRSLRYTMHAPFALNLFDRRHPGLQEQLFLSCLDVAAAISAEVLVYHSGRREAGGVGSLLLEALLEAEAQCLREVGDAAAERGVRIAVENMTPTAERKAGMPDCVPYGSDLRALACQIAVVDHPSVGICLDFGHAYLSECAARRDLLEAIEAAAPFVNHLHIHDNFGRPDSHPHYPAHPDLRAIGEADLHMPIGWGTIPFAQIFGRVSFPRSPIALSESVFVDDGVLAANVSALRELIALNAYAGAQLQTADAGRRARS